MFPDATSLEYTDEGGSVPVSLYINDGMFVAPEGGWDCKGRRFQCIFPQSSEAPGPSSAQEPSTSLFLIYFVKFQKVFEISRKI